MKTSGNHGISDLFFKLSRSVFRVIPSYLVFRELSKYVFRKNKSFYEKIFFRVTGSILVQNFGHSGRGFCFGIQCHFHQNLPSSPSNGPNFFLRRSWSGNRIIGSSNISVGTTFPHVWSTLGPPERRFPDQCLFFLLIFLKHPQICVDLAECSEP